MFKSVMRYFSRYITVGCFAQLAAARRSDGDHHRPGPLGRRGRDPLGHHPKRSPQRSRGSTTQSPQVAERRRPRLTPSLTPTGSHTADLGFMPLASLAKRMNGQLPSLTVTPDLQMRPHDRSGDSRNPYLPRSSRSSAKSRSIFALSTTTMDGSSSSVFRTISDTR